jgi:hypothetical protein
MAGAPFFVKAGTHPDRNRRDFPSFYELFSLGGPDSLDSFPENRQSHFLSKLHHRYSPPERDCRQGDRRPQM